LKKCEKRWQYPLDKIKRCVKLLARRTGRGADPSHPSLPKVAYIERLRDKLSKRREFMKAKVVLLLHLYGFDVLLLGLIEKLLLGLSKRVAALKDAATISLNRCKNRNG
jgi:hypothetical protein